jgi:hypothetical protein
MGKAEVFKFWMVWREGSPVTRYQHQTKADALREAERLSCRNPDEVFFVLKTVAAVKSKASPIEHLKLVQDEIPF